MKSPAQQRREANGWGHPGWERYEGPTNGYGRPLYDDDSAVVTVPEPGKYRVAWDVGTCRFKLIPLELEF